MKKTIEIDVPDGYEIAGKCGTYDYDKKTWWVTINFKKKEPKFVEVRDYLVKFGNRVELRVILREDYHVARVDLDSYFIRWTSDWRKVEI